MIQPYRVLLAPLALAAAAAAFTGCRGTASKAETADPAARPAAVLGPNDVWTMAPTDLIAGVPVSGTLEPNVDIKINASTPEVLEAVLVKEGQAVHRGQVLARLSTAAIGPAAASAAAALRMARADYDRTQNLYTEGAVAEHDVEMAEVALKNAQAADAAAARRLAEATVRAPVSGVIAQRLHDAGDRVKDGDQLFRLVNTSELEFEATVPSQYVGDIKIGAPALLTVTGLDSAGVTAHVARINATADPATRQVKVYVNVPNPTGRIVAGLYASGRLVTREVKGALALPQAGVRRDDQGKTYVLVVVDGAVARRDVVVGAYDEQQNLVEIKSGLAAGEVAIVGPIEGLNVGDRVEVVGRES
jgi:membrane fusion protein (multidrug efflux system)